MEFEISLSDLRFHARHGVFPQERTVGNEFSVSVSVRIPYNPEIEQDSLEATISYADIFAVVAAEMEKPRKLLETVAASIRKELAERWPEITGGSISICKMRPPVAKITGGASVRLIF